ncbi:MAG: hypothetical protein AB8B86_00360 [Pseudomonadales bacterium]
MATDGSQTDSTNTRDAQKITIKEYGTPISRKQFLTLLANNKDFRAFFNTILAQISYESFRWETPLLSRYSQHEIFECVVLNAPDLKRPANKLPFADLFNRMQDQTVASFPNLGNDALMILPKPLDEEASYSQIGDFVRRSPPEQWQTLWQLVGKSALDLISENPIWLNTAGAGVAWLHVRLDQQPKYYEHTPYKQHMA